MRGPRRPRDRRPGLGRLSARARRRRSEPGAGEEDDSPDRGGADCGRRPHAEDPGLRAPRLPGEPHPAGRGDNPQAHLTEPCAPGLHQAIWSLNVTSAVSPLTVYLYVDTITSGPEAAFASVKIQLCLAGPIGTPGCAQLLDAFFDINGVFTNPTASGYRVWRSTFT